MLSPSENKGTSSKTLPAYQRFQSLASPEKPSLTLPFKYRSVAEMFRSIDTVCAMMFNRKETITFNKVKPAVQSMMRRNLTLQHFAQINTLYPDAFIYKWEKMKCFASMKETSELVIVPAVKEVNEAEAVMNPTCLLERRRKLFNSLIEKVKDYHDEFLKSLDPPMDISRDKITRWHPEFDIEKVPDIEETELPQQPEEEKMTTGQEVLEKARSLFSCNTRMEKALEKLKQLQDTKPAEEKTNTTAAAATPEPASLKGIPKSLLEKIRAKQAAKALDAMTRSSSQDKEAVMYSRLPDIARLMRNTFVAEKKGVLPLEDCIIKLNNSYRSRLTNSEIEEHLRLLSKVVPGWLVFHEIRRTLFVKLSRDGDMGKVMTRLDQLAKEKSGS